MVIEQVKTLRSQGVSIAEIARQFNISRPTVYKYLAADEQPAQGRPATREPQDKDIVYRQCPVDNHNIIELLIAVCWQAHEDNDRSWLRPIQDDAKIVLENRANDHVARWIHSKAKRRI